MVAVENVAPTAATDGPALQENLPSEPGRGVIAAVRQHLDDVAEGVLGAGFAVDLVTFRRVLLVSMT